MMIVGMNHFTVLSSDLNRSKQFYVELLDFKEGYRPEFSFPGAWLYIDDQPILHIMTDRPMPDKPAGVIDHMAFTASNLQSMVDRLKQRGIVYDLHRLKGLGTWQLFFHDPDGAKIELDFSANEAEPH